MKNLFLQIFHLTDYQAVTRIIKQHLGKSDTLILTLDAGKGYFFTKADPYIKTYTFTFKKGDTLKKILNANNFQRWTVFYSDNDESFLFGYEENGIFYYPDWFCDEEGNWVDEYQTFTTSTVSVSSPTIERIKPNDISSWYSLYFAYEVWLILYSTQKPVPFSRVE
jgi:hypothetical protein